MIAINARKSKYFGIVRRTIVFHTFFTPDHHSHAIFQTRVEMRFELIIKFEQSS